MCAKSHVHQSCKGLAKILFPPRGMLKFTYEGRFLVFQSFIFGQILAVLGSFGQIWANFVAFIVAKNMPELGLKS
jgi:hypothetical protein